MNEINHIQQTRTYIASSRWAEGDPTAELGKNGLLNIRPTGDPGELYLSMTVDRWNQLVAAVDSVLPKAEIA